MKPPAMALVFLLLLAGAGLAEAGRQNQNQREAKGSWGRKGYGRQQDHRNERQYYGHGHFHSRADSRQSSRHRRRRSKSDSRSPSRRVSSKKPAEAKESPGYLEYKQQKQEAQQWQERRLQAQALAWCLEEREQQRLQAAGPSSQLVPPLPHMGKQAAPEVAAPPPKEESTSSSSTPKPGALEGVSGSDLIPTATLRLVEAELGHVLSLGDKPLSAAALETKLAAAKRKGKSMDAFISRYGKGQNKAPPTRITAKAKVVAAIAQELRL